MAHSGRGPYILGVPFPALTGSVILASLALNLLAMAMPLVTLQIFDRIIPNQSHATLSLLFLGLCCVAVMEFGLRWARVVLVGESSSRFEEGLSRAVMGRWLNADPSAFARDTLGTHFERSEAMAQLREHYAGQSRLLTIDIPFALTFATLIAIIGGWLVLVPLGTLMLVALATLAINRHKARVFEKRKSVDERRYSFLIEFLSFIDTAKSLKIERQMLRRYEMLNQQQVAASRDMLHLSGITQAVGGVLGPVSTASMGLFGAYLAIGGGIGIGDLAACMLLNGRCAQPCLKLLGFWGQSQGVRQSLQRLEDIAALPQAPVVARAVSLNGEITLDRLGLRHPESGAVLFDQVSARIPAGAAAGFTGRSGGGRSSLLRMLLAEQTPTSGTAVIDNQAPARFRDKRGPGGIVYLSKSPTIFRGSIIDNLTLFGLVKDRDTALRAAEEIGLEAEIRALPHGFQTMLAPDGGALSQSLLQQICLARALAMAPRILILNNAASAMDTRATTHTATALKARAGAMTRLIVATHPALTGLSDISVSLQGAVPDPDTIRAWDDDLRSEHAETATQWRNSA